MPEETTRRLAAIMMGDIAGYSRLMGADERGTHARVQLLLRELIDPTIAEHRGRVLRTRGDGFLAMFDSPVEAVRCAIVIQQSMVGRNLELPDTQWIRFRIGVNLGDVIVEPDDIYGEGVNVAARLEQLAEPGNIYISGGVYEQIRYKLVCGYQSLGDRKVKNILDPVPIYRVLPDPAAVARAARSRKVRLALLGVGTLVAVGIGGGGWYFWERAWERHTEAEAAATQPAVQPAPPVASTLPVTATSQSASAPPAPASAAPAQSAPSTTAAPAAQMQAAVIPPRVQINQPDAKATVTEPEMIPIAGGTFRMGSAEDASEEPAHNVTVAPFLIAKYPITNRQWRECVNARACSYVPNGGDDAPVSNVSWDDAKQFVAWLSQCDETCLSPPQRSRVGIRGARGHRDALLVGQCDEAGSRGLQGMRRSRSAGESRHAHCESVTACTISAAVSPSGLRTVGTRTTAVRQPMVHRVPAWIVASASCAGVPGGTMQATCARQAVIHYDASVRYPTHGVRVARSP